MDLVTDQQAMSRADSGNTRRPRRHPKEFVGVFDLKREVGKSLSKKQQDEAIYNLALKSETDAASFVYLMGVMYRF